MFCPQCGTQLSDDALICTNCNEPLEALKEIPLQPIPVITQAPAAEQVSVPQPEMTEAAPGMEVQTPAKKHSCPPKVLLICSIVLVLLVGLTGAAYHFVLPKLLHKGPGTALYMKGDQLYTTRLSELQPWQVTSKLLNADKSIMDSNEYYLSVLIDQFTCLTEDGKTVFYPDKYDFTNLEAGMTIYYRQVTDSAEAAKKLDDDISEYAVSPDGKRVIYLTADGTLYRYNMQDWERLASDVTEFYASENCRHVIYCVDNEKPENPSETVYAQTEGKDKIKLTNHSTGIAYVNNKCNTIYYRNEDSTLFKAVIDGEKIEIAQDVAEVLRVYESGEIYYTTRDYQDTKSQLTGKQFLKDDAVSDTSKNALRQNINKMEIPTAYVDAICYFNGKESVELADDCYLYVGSATPYCNPVTALDAPVLTFFTYDIDKIGKVKLSQIGSEADMVEEVEKIAEKARTYFVAVKESVTELDLEKVSDIQLTDDGKAVYYTVDDDPDDKKHSDTLYQLPIKNGAPQEALEYDTKVFEFLVLDSDLILSVKNMSEKDSTCDLYINGELVDETVSQIEDYDADRQVLCYFTDWDKDDSCGKLHMWKNGKVTTIASDVHTCEIVGDEVLYLSDYRKSKDYGTLYRFKNGESDLVDDEVSYIMDSSTYFGKTYRDMYYETAF